MRSLLWTGDPPPDLENWELATCLRRDIDAGISQIRNMGTNHVGYIVPGKTPVWKGIIEKLKSKDPTGVAILDLNRGNGTVTLLENGGQKLEEASNRLSKVSTEKMHLATCRACDFGITRTAGGVLGFAETWRPSVLVDEPGHWLGRIQRDQCRAAGLCVVASFSEFHRNPADTIQRQADKLGTNSDLDETVEAARKLSVGAEANLADYLFRTYIE